MVRLGHVLRFHRTEVRRLAFWRPKPGEDWRRRLALTYALSVWSMIGFVAYMQWQKKDVFQRPKTDDETIPDLEEDPIHKRKQRVAISTSIQYKEGHVPYSTRIYQYLIAPKKAPDGGPTEN